MHDTHARPPSELILNGWKEIANHMRRGVRTVQRWERAGLPVHRPSARAGASVVANTTEIDEWLIKTHARPQDLLSRLQIRIKLLEAENADLRRQIMQIRAGRAKKAHRRTAGERSAA
ncbi:MAG: hypothetical protein ACM3SW_11725 [Actinomycetota bacterium]